MMLREFGLSRGRSCAVLLAQKRRGVTQAAFVLVILSDSEESKPALN